MRYGYVFIHTAQNQVESLPEDVWPSYSVDFAVSVDDLLS